MRLAGQPNSPASRKLLLQSQDRKREFDVLWRQSVLEKNEVRDVMSKLSSDEWLMFGRHVASKDSFQSFVKLVQEGKAPADMTPNVKKALDTYLKQVDLDFVRRDADWHKSIATRLRKADKILQDWAKSKGKTISIKDVRRVKLEPGKLRKLRDPSDPTKTLREIELPEAGITDSLVDASGRAIGLPPEIEKKILTQLRDAPPWMEFYYSTLAKEVATGVKKAPVIKSAKRTARFNESRTPAEAQIEDLDEFFGSSKGRRDFIQSFENIVGRAPSQFNEASADLFIKRIQRERGLAFARPAESFGSQFDKDRIVKGLDDLLADAKNRLNPTQPKGVFQKSWSQLWRGYDTALNTMKQGWLFFTPGWYIQNFADNNVKNIIALGPADFARALSPNLRPALKTASALDFTIGLKNLTGSRESIGGIFDVPGVGPQVGKAVSFLSDSIERSTRNHLGAFIYHKTVKGLQEAAKLTGKEIPAGEMHRQGMNAANATLQKVQFFTDDLTQFERVMERIVPFSATFGVPNLRFWADTVVSNPTASATLLRIREAIVESSLDARGHIKLTDKLRIRPETSSSINNAIRLMEGTVDPSKLSENDTLIGRAAAVFESGVNAFARGVPSHLRLIDTLLTDTGLLELTKDPEDFKTRKEQRDFLFSTRSIVGPLNEYSRMIYGMDLDLLLGSDDFKLFRVEEFERWRRWQQNLEMKSAEFAGRGITKDEGMETALRRIRTRGIARAFGLDIVFDESDEMTNFLRRRAEIMTAPTFHERMVLMQQSLDGEGQSIFRGTVPDPHNPGAFAEEWAKLDAETDTIKKMEILRGFHEDTQRGLQDGLPRFFFGEEGLFRKSWKRARDLGSEAGDQARAVEDAVRSEIAFQSGSGVAYAADTGVAITEPYLSGQPFDDVRKKNTAAQWGQTRKVLTDAKDGTRLILSFESFEEAMKVPIPKPTTAEERQALLQRAAEDLSLPIRSKPETKTDQPRNARFQVKNQIGLTVIVPDLSATEKFNTDHSNILNAIPIPSKTVRGDFQFVQQKFMTADGFKIDGRTPTKKEVKFFRDQQVDLQRAWDATMEAWRGARDTPEEVRAFDQTVIEVKRAGGSTFKFNVGRFAAKVVDENGVQKAWMSHALTRMQAQNTKFFLQKSEAEFQDWFDNGNMTGDAKRTESERKRVDRERFQKWRIQMQNASRAPDQHRLSAIKVLSDIESLIGTKGPEALPKDFYERFIANEDLALLGDFSLAVRAESLPLVEGLVYTEDGSGKKFFDPEGFDLAVATGFGDVLAMLAFSDRNVKRAIEERSGRSFTFENVRSVVLADFFEKREIEITPAIVAGSAGVLTKAILPAGQQDAVDAILKADPNLMPADDSVKAIIPVDPDSPNQVQKSSAAQDDKLAFATEEASQLAANAPPVPFKPAQIPAVLTDRFTSSALARSIRMPDRPFRSVTEFIQAAARETRASNERIFENVVAASQGIADPEARVAFQNSIPRNTIFDVGRRFLPLLSPTDAARGAQGVMQLGNALGVIDNDTMRVINTGINTAALQGQGQRVALNILAVTSKTLGGLTSAQRISKLRARGLTKSAKFAQVGAPAGELLSLASGFVSATGGDVEIAAGLGAAGGAISGAAIGITFGPIGAVVGAVLGGTLGAILPLVGGDDGASRRRAEFLELQRQQRARQDLAREEARARASASVATRTARALADPAAQRRTDGQRFDRLTQFFRRPTFQSSLGLVGDVERRAVRKFRPTL